MEIGEQPATATMTIAKPGERHSSLSLQLHWSREFQYQRRDSLPPSYICIAALPTTPEAPSLLQHKGIFRIGPAGVEDVQTEPEIDSSTEAYANFIQLKLAPGGNTEFKIFFDTAIVAVFGFKYQPIFEFRPNIELLFFSRQGLIPLEWIDIKKFENIDRELPELKVIITSRDIPHDDNWRGRVASSLEERAGNLRRGKVTREELLRRLREQRQKENERREAERREVERRGTLRIEGAVATGGNAVAHVFIGNSHLLDPPIECIGMQDLLLTCLHRLMWDQTGIQWKLFPHQDEADSDNSVSISDETVQSVAETIIRAMIFHTEFARHILSTLSESMKWFKEDGISNRNRSPWLNDSERLPSVVCCAFILLCLIGQRAEYLYSGDELYQCLERWKNVYIA
jgi:hypothetical protein